MTNTLKIAVLSLAFSVAAVLVARADFEPTKWQFKKDIIAPAPIDTRTFVELVFDNEVFSKANGNLSDARVVNGAYEEVPYVLVTEAPKRTRGVLRGRVLNKGSVPGEYTTFLVDVGEGGIFHNQLTIVTDAKNFRREAMIEGSNDQINWLVLNPKQSLYDYTLEFKAQDTTVRYPESTFRYLRVKIFDRGEPPLNIIHATVDRDVETPAKKIFYDGKIISRMEDVPHRASILTFDLGAKGLPTNGVIFRTSDVNFSREAALEASNDGEKWSVVSFRDVIFSYDTPKFSGAKLGLNYPEQNFRYLRFTIFNKDNKPIAIDGAQFSGFLRKLVFEYIPGVNYAFYYGNPEARFPEYDLVNYIAYFDPAARREVGLGGEAVNDSYAPKVPPPVPFTERYPNLLTIVLAAAVLVVGFLTVRLIKRTPKG